MKIQVAPHVEVALLQSLCYTMGVGKVLTPLN